MNTALPSALADPPIDLIDTMPVNAKDRHVAALAVQVGAGIIVTENLRDFPSDVLEPLGIEAIDTDAFVSELIERNAAAVLEAIDAIAARRRRHPRTPQDIVVALSRLLPESMDALDLPH